MFHIVTTVGSFFNKVHNYRMLIVKEVTLLIFALENK